MPKKTLPVKEIVHDVKSGMPDQELMSKYDLSRDKLNRLLNKLADLGRLSHADLGRRPDPPKARQSSAPPAVTQGPLRDQPPSGKKETKLSPSETAAFRELLSRAVSGDSKSVTEILNNVGEFLERGADPNTKTDEGWTALTLAAGWGHLDAMNSLLEFGAAIDSQSNFGTTALMNACSYCHRDAVALLVGWGAEAGIRDNDGRTAMDISLGSRDKWDEIVEALRGAKE